MPNLSPAVTFMVCVSAAIGTTFLVVFVLKVLGAFEDDGFEPDVQDETDGEDTGMDDFPPTEFLRP